MLKHFIFNIALVIILFGCQEESEEPIIEPVLGEVTFSNVRATSATLKTSFTVEGNQTIMNRGFIYKENNGEELTLDNGMIATADGASFESTISDLKTGTNYVVQSFVEIENQTILSQWPYYFTTIPVSFTNAATMKKGGATDTIQFATQGLESVDSFKLLFGELEASYVSPVTNNGGNNSFYAIPPEGLMPYNEYAIKLVIGESEIESFSTFTFLPGKWTRMNDFPGEKRKNATGFTLGETAYLGLGYNQHVGYLNDFWKYDLATDSWVAVESFPGQARYDFMTFTLDGNAYIVGGVTENDEVTSEVWAYDMAANTWAQKGDFAGGVRRSGFGCASTAYGFVGMGYDISQVTNTAYITKQDIWRYTPNTDSWELITNLPEGPYNYGTIGNSKYGIYINGSIYIGIRGAYNTYNEVIWKMNLDDFNLSKVSDHEIDPFPSMPPVSIGNDLFFGNYIYSFEEDMYSEISTSYGISYLLDNSLKLNINGTIFQFFGSRSNDGNAPFEISEVWRFEL